MTTVSVINYGMGNIDSICRAIEKCGASAQVISSAEEVKNAERLIIPGVGSFDVAMENLESLSLVGAIQEAITIEKKPLLGICLGMQLLAVSGYEGKGAKGLGAIPGEIRLLEKEKPAERVPHIGWNEVNYCESALFDNIKSGSDFYFVHSYQYVCEDDKHVIATTNYCGRFTSAIQKDHIMGVQFHPEKSQKVGLQLIQNFIKM